jgi:hypothetical protein
MMVEAETHQRVLATAAQEALLDQQAASVMPHAAGERVRVDGEVAHPARGPELHGGVAGAPGTRQLREPSRTHEMQRPVDHHVVAHVCSRLEQDGVAGPGKRSSINNGLGGWQNTRPRTWQRLELGRTAAS